jgi:hypothetical protein
MRELLYLIPPLVSVLLIYPVVNYSLIILLGARYLYPAWIISSILIVTGLIRYASWYANRCITSESIKAEKRDPFDNALRVLKSLSIIGIIVIASIIIYESNNGGLFPNSHYIKIDNIKVLSNEGIGDDWNFDTNINGHNLGVGDQIETGGRAYRIKMVAEERDEYSDVGIKTKTINKNEVGYHSVIVPVRETKGKGAGKTARVEFSFVVK